MSELAQQPLRVVNIRATRRPPGLQPARPAPGLLSPRRPGGIGDRTGWMRGGGMGWRGMAWVGLGCTGREEREEDDKRLNGMT